MYQPVDKLLASEEYEEERPLMDEENKPLMEEDYKDSKLLTFECEDEVSASWHSTEETSLPWHESEVGLLI
jgi:hypothetical protein